MKSSYYLPKSPITVKEIYNYDLRLHKQPNIMSGIKIPHFIFITVMTIVVLTLLMLYAPFPYIVSYLIAFFVLVIVTYIIMRHNRFDFLAYLFVFIEDDRGNFYLVYNQNQEPVSGMMLKRYFDDHEYLGEFLNEQQAYEKILNSERYLEGINVRVIKNATLLKEKKRLVRLEVTERNQDSHEFLSGHQDLVISTKYKNSQQLYNRLLKK